MIANIVAKKDDIIQCPGCGLRIARITRDLKMYQALVGSDFEGIPYPISDGDRTTCQECGSDWFLGGQLHLTTGWTYK